MLTRRLAAGALLGMGFAAKARAQAFPDQPVRMLIGFPPGGTVDTIGRIISGPIGERLGGSIVVENRAGAAGAIAIRGVAQARPDGHTVVLGSAGALAVMPHLLDPMPFRHSEIAPITMVAKTPQVMVVGKHVPANSVAEFVELAKKQPGKYTFGSTGVGSTLHLAGELFKMRTGTDLLHVPYRGGAPAATAMLAGEIDLLIVDIPVVMAHISDGNFKALALASSQRVDALPNTPTMEQAGVKDMIAEGWYAFYAPVGTPADRVEKIRAATMGALADATIRRSLANLGAVAQTSTPDELATFARDEYTKWGEVVRVSGAKLN